MADLPDVDAFSLHHGKLVLFVVRVRMLYDGGDHRHGFLLLRTFSFPEFLLILESLRCWFIVGSMDPKKVQIWRYPLIYLFCIYVSSLFYRFFSNSHNR